MQRLEQEIKELQVGLGAVIQALSFLQNFLESDFGLKFQFHAYSNSPLYSHNSNLLEVLKQKYGNENSSYDNSTIVYQHQESSSQPGGNEYVRLEPGVNVISSCAGSCTTQTLGQTFVTVTNATDLATSHHPENAPVGLGNDNNDRTPINVNENEIHIFGISELASMKEESHEIYQHEGDIRTFGKQDFEDNSESNDEDANVKNSDVGAAAVSKKSDKIIPTNSNNLKTRGGRTLKKDKIGDGYKCPHCRRRCPDREKLELHMSHHKQQFQCAECGIWLADKSVLNRHMRTHTGDRPFTCEFCKETFTRQDIVKKHILRKHKDMTVNGTILGGIKYNKPASIS